MRSTLPLIPAMSALLLAGCSILSRPFVPVRYYSIDPPAAEPRPGTQPADLILAVRALGSAPRYRERILFRRGALAAGFHENDRWVEPPSDMVTTVLRRTLEAGGIARVVADDRLVRRPDLLLDGCLTRFDEVQRDPHWLAECEIELVLKQADDGSVLFAGRFAASRDAGGKTTAAFVEAMRAAAAEVAAKAAEAVAKALAEPKKADRKP
ncbi:MAG TPA: ABC-type transport auxiliary lipoprotein family protein [Planctomycetota bacterium]|nr:ABC-type transport auxiliary lipoprotein family protein [Planctomycetota bacterium]